MKELFTFLLALVEPLTKLFEYVMDGGEDPDVEKQIAMEIVRKAKDEKARREIQG